jgi:hypothetical protein
MATKKLTWEQVREIRSSKETAFETAQRYGIHPGTVTTIRLGMTWKRDPLIYGDRETRRSPATGQGKGNRKLTKSQVLEIRSLSKAYTLDEIAERYGITKVNVWYIRTGRSWKHLLPIAAE